MENPTTPNQNQIPIQDSIPPVVTPPTPPVMPTPAKLNNPLLMLLIAIILLLALGATGFFAYQNRQLKQQISQMQPIPTSPATPSPIITSIPDLTANWKTYTSKNINYAIKVPSQYMLDERGLPNLHFSIKTNGTPQPGLQDAYIEVALNCTKANECLNRIITSLRGGQSAGSGIQFSLISTTIAGAIVNGIESWDPGVNQGGTVRPSSLIYEYFVDTSGKVLDLQFTISGYLSLDQARTQKELVDHMLSTFKLTGGINQLCSSDADCPEGSMCTSSSGAAPPLNSTPPSKSCWPKNGPLPQ